MHILSEPEDFIVRFADLVPHDADVLDVAAGSGRHSVFFARRGCRVFSIEREPDLVAALKDLGIEAVEGDIEKAVLLPNCFDAVINTFFLFRPLLSQYLATLRPNGILFFRTYTTAHMDVLGRTRPRRDFLLEPGELKTAFPNLAILHYDESIDEHRATATIVARKPSVVTE